jgi:uncharacterized protein
MKKLLISAAMLLFPCHAVAAKDDVFDVHVHLWDGEASIRSYDAQLKASNVEVTGFAGMWFGGPNQAKQGQPAETRSGNDKLVALAAKHPGMLPVATVHPYDGQDALLELQRVAALGVKVLKIHPHTQQFEASDPRVLALVRRAGELGIVVLMDNANIVPADSQNLFNLALKAPRTKFIFAHMGAMNFRFWNILKLARTAEDLFANNIYFDISATVTLAADSPIEEEFVWTMRNVGIDYLLLGSDYPQLSLPQTLRALDQLGLGEGEKAKIKYGNAQKLFGLKTPPD